jgi:DNA modification methylase
MQEQDAFCLSQEISENFSLYHGDSFEIIKSIPAASVGLSVFSPPFPGMYCYGNSHRDMGNTKTIKENINQFEFMMPELLRITKLGRSCCIHLCQSVAFKNQDGYIGIKDFRGRVIQSMEDAGWIYYGEVCIDKCPQLKAIRTKDQGLLFKSLATDASRMHMALADYLLQFRKPGDNTEPIKAGISEKYQSDGGGWITSEEWIEWAAPVWYRKTKNYPGGIKETDVLQYRHAKDKNDEKHLCPLQLGVIERAIKLWSNPGDIVFSPFAGIGSEGYMALKLQRKFVGCELKESYYRVAVNNLNLIEKEWKQLNLNHE